MVPGSTHITHPCVTATRPVDVDVVGHLHVRDLDDDLHRAIRIEAIERGESLKEFVTRALRRELERSRGERRRDDR